MIQRTSKTIPLSLLAELYASSPTGSLTNLELYDRVAGASGMGTKAVNASEPIGRARKLHSPVQRTIRWYQQTLKQMGVLERVEDQRGVWRLSEHAGKGLNRIIEGNQLVAFSTRLGVAIWSRHSDVFGSLNEPISLCVTSPPYPLRKERAYGGPSSAEFSDFMCTALEGTVRNLQPGGSIVLVVSNDVFEERSPARSLYLERLILALHDRLGLALMDRVPWVNYSKPPAPTWWACVNRVQLAVAYEHQLWFTNDPARVRSDNRRVLEEHSARHRQLMAAGGENRIAVYGDGAYKVRETSFSRETSGRLPRNIMERGHSCADTRAYRQNAKSMGLPTHGAMLPTSLPEFWIKFLTEGEDDLVVDPFGGTVRTGLAAERLGRRWLVTEWIREYLQGASTLFRGAPGFACNL